MKNSKKQQQASDESSIDSDSEHSNVSYNTIKQHASYGQVMLDVNRCAGRLEQMRQIYHHRTDDDGEPPEDLTEKSEPEESLSNQLRNDKSDAEASSDESGGNRSCDQKELKRKLAKLIVKLLIKKSKLHYYQGFHDVCLTYMTLLGDSAAFKKLDKLVDSHFSMFMRPTMNETQEFLALIPIIVRQHNPKLQEFLERAEVGTIFALSWVITWFSHVIPNANDVESIFMFLEKQDPSMVLYLSASIVLHKQDQILELEPEMSTVHHFLCQVPRKEKLPIAHLIKKAKLLFEEFPPDQVKRKLDRHRRVRFQLHNYNLVQNLAYRIAPTLTSLLQGNTKTALIVFAIASAFAIGNWSNLINPK